MWIALCYTGNGASGDAAAFTAAGAHEIPGEGQNGNADVLAKGAPEKIITADKPEPQVPLLKVGLLVLLFACEPLPSAQL